MRLTCLSLLLLVACATEASEPTPSEPGGAGGAGGAPGCAELGTSGSCRREGPSSGCASDEACALTPAASCGEASCCTLPFACSPARGLRPGGFRCEDDGDCESGSCLFVAGGSFCLRACTTEGGCLPGFTCALHTLDQTRSFRACVGEDERGALDGRRVLCLADGDCPDGRYCQVQAGSAFYDGAAFGLCVEGTRSQRGLTVTCEAAGPLSLGEGGEGPALPARSTGWSDACTESGLCHAACVELDPEACNCRQPQDVEFCRGARCVPPCRIDDDCPSPMRCIAGREQEFTAVDPDLRLKFCGFPVFVDSGWGCFDETDCCRGGRQRHGGECCNHDADGICTGAIPDRTHCRVTPEVGRYTSRCELPTGRGEPGAPCTAHAACESELCAPEGRCTSPCDPGPGDRCDELLPGTQCCPTPVADACIPSCRADCAGGPTCTP